MRSAEDLIRFDQHVLIGFAWVFIPRQEGLSGVVTMPTRSNLGSACSCLRKGMPIGDEAKKTVR